MSFLKKYFSETTIEQANKLDHQLDMDNCFMRQVRSRRKKRILRESNGIIL